MNEPVRVTYSCEEFQQAAKQYMVDTYGRPAESTIDRDEWMLRMGILVDFVGTLFDSPHSGRST